MGKSVVVVGQIQGQVWMRDAQGNLHALHAGMEIPADAVLVKEPGSEVTLQGHENMEFQAPEGQTATLMENGAPAAELSEAAIADAGAQDMASLITALNSGKDIFEDLEATEAVLTGDAGAGGSYVTLANVVESTSAMSLQYAATGIPSAGDNAKLGGSVAGADAPLGGGLDGNTVVPAPPKQDVLFFIPKSTDQFQVDPSVDYAFHDSGVGKPGKLYIALPDGVEIQSIKFAGHDFPLDQDHWESHEMEYADLIFNGTNKTTWDEDNIDNWHDLDHSSVQWGAGTEVYELDFIFIYRGDPRDYSNGPVYDEYWFEITTTDGDVVRYPLVTQPIDPFDPNYMSPMAEMAMVAVDEDRSDRTDEEDEHSLIASHNEEETIWLGSGGDLDFTGSELSSHLKNVDVLDLTLEGAAHTISYLGVDDVLDMSGGKDILTILADGDDSIGFDTKDVWALNAEKSASGDFNVYEGLSQDGELVEVRISKSFEGGVSGLAKPEAVVPNAHVASAPQLSIDMEGQQVLAMQVLDQAKVIIDQG